MIGDLPFIWQVVVVVLTIAGLMYLLFLGIMIYFAKEPVHHEIMWDETLEEGQAPVPAWWFWSGIAAAIFAVLYMLFFPSFGNFKGLLDASLDNEFIKHKSNIDDKYYRGLNTLTQADIKTLQANPNAMRLAKNTFAQYCESCHGKDGIGQINFPNLTDQAWFWGSSEAQITRTIAQGRKAIMPAWGAILQEQGVDNVAKYIQSVAENTDDKDAHSVGKAKYKQFCSSCHGATLQGNPIFGAPNLSDSAWIYGGDLASIKDSIRLGRQGVMPAHKDRLTPLQIKLLVAWLKKNAE
ncbi:Cytochrome c oxidase subunit CcoP [uncultured Candidatus Thioglobus sp.]|nr:Cytochrome c oxidase subunit CcoP [uncultured Candidatus Thioglobus sp.]